MMLINAYLQNTLITNTCTVKIIISVEAWADTALSFGKGASRQ